MQRARLPDRNWREGAAVAHGAGGNPNASETIKNDQKEPKKNQETTKKHQKTPESANINTP
jgi:hypothetical protein